MDSYIYLKDRAGNNLGTSDNPLVIYATGGATSTTVHNDLLSIQGGNGSDEYYHLNLTSYSSVIAWDVGGGSGDYAAFAGYATTCGTATNATYAISSGYATNSAYAVAAANATTLNTHADTYFATSGATLNVQHNSTLNKQGNGVDYYHLDSTQYASVAAWNVAGSPTYVPTAGYATNASYATAAGSATNSTYSVSSGTATNATYSVTSGSATNATYAVSSGSATNSTYSSGSGTATNATYSVTSGTATNATYAVTCGTASSIIATATVAATKVILPLLSGTSLYQNVNGWFDVIQSGGRIQGGVITASATAGLADVSQCDVFIKTQDSEIGGTMLYTVAATAGLTLYSDTVTYIYVDYNGGTPIIRTTNDRTTIKYTNQFNLGRAFKHADDEVEVLVSGINTSNRTRRVHERWVDTFGGVSYANGLVVSCTGLKPAITSGVLYAGSNRITVSGTDCNAGGTFEYYYTTDSGSTWTTTSTNTIDNLRYNDSATGLGTLANNQYGVHWVYVCPEGDVYILYGKASYTLAQAQAALVASPIPNYLNQWAKLAAKIIVGKGLTSVTQITSAWTTQFPIQNQANHNDLGGLEGLGTNYYHLNATQYASVSAWNVGTPSDYVVTSAYATNSGYATACGTATNATYAIASGTATNATYAITSGTATNATYAVTCGTATLATNAASLNNRADTYFATSGATLNTKHNALPDKQGNGTDYYHLDATQYASVAAWNVAGSPAYVPTSGYATNAGYSISSGTATNATYSVGSGTATNASYALVAANATLFNGAATTSFLSSTSAATPTRTLFLSLAGGWTGTASADGGFVTTTATVNVINFRGTKFQAATTDIYHEHGCAMPLNWDGGTITARPYFLTTATDASSHTIVFTLQGVGFADGDNLETAWGVTQYSTTTVESSIANKLKIGAETAAITIGNTSTGGEWVQFRTTRVGSDTFTGDVYHLGWLIKYTTDTYSDV